MNKRTLFLGLLLTASVALPAYSFLRLRVGAADGMTAAATDFLATLSKEQQAKAIMPYDSAKRTDWHFIPKDTRKGLQIREMNQDQRKVALALLRTTLSEVGYGKATKTMEMEGLLKELEKSRTTGPLRDPERYYFTVFGQPSPKERWGLSIEGHHISLNFVVEGNKVISSSPTALAANPANVMTDTIPSIEKGFRMLKAEEQTAFDLHASFTAEQKKIALIAEKALPEIRAAGEAQPPNTPAAGLPGDQMTPEQQSQLKKLIGVYAANMAEDISMDRVEAIEKAGIGKVHFAWAGADKPGIGHYYRVQGPTFLIEFVNTQADAAGNPANHIHCIWRDMAGDFALPIASGK